MPYLPHRSRSLQSRRGARLHKAPERRHVRPSQRRPRQEDRLRPLLHQAGDLGQWARALVRAIAEDDRLARRLAGGRRLQQPQVPVDVPVERAAEASRLGCPHDYRRAHGGEVGRRRAGGEAGGEALVHAKRHLAGPGGEPQPADHRALADPLISEHDDVGRALPRACRPRRRLRPRRRVRLPGRLAGLGAEVLQPARDVLVPRLAVWQEHRRQPADDRGDGDGGLRRLGRRGLGRGCGREGRRRRQQLECGGGEGRWQRSGQRRRRRRRRQR
mmetsp:Transcript_30499/g.92998  ORF Transcript_30499/g.92998 Transcript_30499/m.92998 type:complete len:273 (+) Transcript_30499:157-975(+)